MKGLNVAYIVGHLGAAPETKTTDMGLEIATFTVATTEKYKNKSGELVENTEWHKIVCYGAICKVCSFLHKGSKVLVSGRLKTTKYQDKNGIDKYMTQIICKDIILLDSKNNSTSNNTATVNNSTDEVPDFDDDLPF